MAERAAARLLLLEAVAIEPILQDCTDGAFDLPTVCDGWTVRDVMAHCAAVLTRAASGDLHGFTPEDNQRDIELRRSRAIGQVLAELLSGYEAAAAAIDAAQGALDGIGLGEWIHGGDIRAALGLPDAYSSAGIDLALDLLVQRSQARDCEAVTVALGDIEVTFGVGDPVGAITTDTETFVRICGGRRPEPARVVVSGAADVASMVLFD